MQVLYRNNKLKNLCEELSIAKKKLPEKIALATIKSINFIIAAESLNDVIQDQPFRFHDLKGKEQGIYAIDIGSKREGYRMQLIPLDEEGNEVSNNQVFGNASSIKVVKIWEVGNHYEWNNL